MKEGGKILAAILRVLEKEVRPGMATKELDERARALMAEHKVKPSFLGYQNFPAVLCTSVNEEAVHAVPSDRVLTKGDVLKLDIGVIHGGLHTDMAVTVVVGGKHPDKQVAKLLQTTQEALSSGIRAARPGHTVGDIGEAIHRAATQSGFFILQELGGHGIGTQLHESPFIPNYRDRGYNQPLVPGMTLALEPILSAGTMRIKDGPDGFAYVTADGSLAAQFEHTILVTPKGALVLTQ